MRGTELNDRYTVRSVGRDIGIDWEGEIGLVSAVCAAIGRLSTGPRFAPGMGRCRIFCGFRHTFFDIAGWWCCRLYVRWSFRYFGR